MISIKITNWPKSIEEMRAGLPRVISAVTTEMNELMAALAAYVKTTTIPRYFKTSAILSESIAVVPAQVVETKIVGIVRNDARFTTKETMGGPHAGEMVNWAGVQEYGAPNPWDIRPILLASAQSLHVKRMQRKEGLAQTLAFMLDGRIVFTTIVHHPQLAARPFMGSAQEEMREQIVAGLQGAAYKALSG
jgi:hypothetical protein